MFFLGKKADKCETNNAPQVVYISCSHRNEVKSWMCAILEAATLG